MPTTEDIPTIIMVFDLCCYILRFSCDHGWKRCAILFMTFHFLSKLHFFTKKVENDPAIILRSWLEALCDTVYEVPFFVKVAFLYQKSGK
jgi:hypothetical protein